jgi:glucose/arabinose dehydrogenase
VLAGLVPSAAAVTLPPGFADEPVATVAGPTALAFTPDGRMLVATQAGRLRVRTAAGALLTTPALDLTATICTNGERGLLGVAVDPAFAANRYVYVFYTFKRFGSCPTNAALTPVNRVARFVLSDSNTVDPGSQTVLVDNMPSYGGNHNAGDLQFGTDGNLYVSIGDGGCDYAGSGCAGSNDAARDEHVLTGKILRIRGSGAIPADNPFAQDPDAARCNVTGRTDVLERCKETYAWGLRNPFRFAIDPDAPGTRLHINDVGQNLWDEIDLGIPGADYGWNVREGHCATGSTSDCGPPPAGMTNPIFDYGHGDGCASITGGAFVPAAVWPAPYAGTYLFGDYVCGKIFQLVPDGAGGYNRLVFADGLGASSAVHLAFGPHGAGRALYYTNYSGGGAVHRIVRVAGNRAPTAGLTAAPTSGPSPLTVAFGGSASHDPDAGDTLTYLWDFGDGAPVAETSGAAISHVYTTTGAFTASLRVRDQHGAVSAPDTQRIDVGNTPPVAVIESPSAGQGFAVGETIDLRATATDEQDGTLAPAALSWTVLRHHAAHTHPYLGPVAGNGESFDGPAPEDALATTNSAVEVRLTATDSHGATATVSRMVAPRLASLALATEPAGLQLSFDGVAFAAPRTWTSWEGWDVTVSAPDQAGHTFASWSDGGARTHAIETPPGGASVTATFTASAPGPTVGSGGDPTPVPQQPPPASSRAEPACRPPRSVRAVRAQIRRGAGTRKVVAIARARIGARTRTRYAVKLTRGCDVLGTGVARGARLELTLTSNGTKLVTRDGVRVRVRTYPRLSGRYLLRPAGRKPRLAVTNVNFVR